MTFRVGQKVVCVDASPFPDKHWAIDVTPPIKGETYTVSRGNFQSVDGITVVDIAELINPYGYRASRFRPIVERKTDISIFTKMLTPEGVDA